MAVHFAQRFRPYARFAAGGSTAALIGFFAILLSCTSNSPTTTPASSAMASATVTFSDPPSCKFPSGTFQHVYVSINSVQAHISASATDSTPGWQELAPQLNTQPVQIDLLGLPPNGCLLATLGSTSSLPAGNYQQIRLILVSNNPGGAPVPATNNCGNQGFNCVVLSNGTTQEIALSSQANTGLKIPPGQIVGGPIHVAAGQNVDINIDFNVCASLIQQGNGQYRLKPVLTAGQASTVSSGISGQVVDSSMMMPVMGGVTLVALEKADSNGVDRIFMQAAADANGNFNFCPLPMGATFDVVVVAINGAGVAYNATVITGVPGGTSLGKIPLVAEMGTATGPGTIQGTVTALNGATGGTIDVALSALQSITTASGSLQVTIPLQGNSTGLISVANATSCPMGSPMGANCGSYSLVVPASNPQVGVFSAGTVAFTAPAAGSVLYSVEADAAMPMSGGVPSCTPSSLMVNQDTAAMPLAVVAGATTTAKEIDFTGCM